MGLTPAFEFVIRTTVNVAIVREAKKQANLLQMSFSD